MRGRTCGGMAAFRLHGFPHWSSCLVTVASLRVKTVTVLVSRVSNMQLVYTLMRYVNEWQKNHQRNKTPLGVWFMGSFIVDVIHECCPFLAQLLFVLFISLHLSLFREDFGVGESLLDERHMNHFCPSLCV